jgi:ribosomal 50S subunit-recycling heat shock protein
MRIDKFLKVSRILKRRSVACDACSGGKVSVNGKDIKPSYQLKENDIVEIRFGSGTIKFKVLILKETVRKEEAPSLYEIITG